VKPPDLKILHVTIKENTGGFLMTLIYHHAGKMHIVVGWCGFLIPYDLPSEIWWIQGKDCRKFNIFL